MIWEFRTPNMPLAYSNAMLGGVKSSNYYVGLNWRYDSFWQILPLWMTYFFIHIHCEEKYQNMTSNHRSNRLTCTAPGIHTTLRTECREALGWVWQKLSLIKNSRYGCGSYDIYTHGEKQCEREQTTKLPIHFPPESFLVFRSCTLLFDSRFDLDPLSDASITSTSWSSSVMGAYIIGLWWRVFLIEFSNRGILQASNDSYCKGIG